MGENKGSFDQRNSDFSINHKLAGRSEEFINNLYDAFYTIVQTALKTSQFDKSITEDLLDKLDRMRTYACQIEIATA